MQPTETQPANLSIRSLHLGHRPECVGGCIPLREHVICLLPRMSRSVCKSTLVPGSKAENEGRHMGFDMRRSGATMNALLHRPSGVQMVCNPTKCQFYLDHFMHLFMQPTLPEGTSLSWWPLS